MLGVWGSLQCWPVKASIPCSSLSDQAGVGGGHKQWCSPAPLAPECVPTGIGHLAEGEGFFFIF